MTISTTIQLPAMGGVINASNSTIAVVGSSFQGNSTTVAAGGNGGAIWSGVSDTLLLATDSFSGNTADASGGAIYNVGDMKVDLSLLGIYGLPAAAFSTFSGNKASDASNGGGAIYNGGTMSLFAIDFSGNGAVNNGGAIYASSSSTQNDIFDSAIVGNGAGDQGGGLFL